MGYQVGDPDPTPELPVERYCFAPHRLPERTVYCSFERGVPHDEHVAADVKSGGNMVVAVFTSTAAPQGRVWSPRDRRPWVLGPEANGLAVDAWTDAMAREGANTGVNRQCSIGWHEECSERDADPNDPQNCRCVCHAFPWDDDEDTVEVPVVALYELMSLARDLAASVGDPTAEESVEKAVAALGLDERVLDDDD